MNKKLIFLDIDGTLTPAGSNVPPKSALEAIRKANGACNTCLAIFTYGLDKAKAAFDNLRPRCDLHAILEYDTMIETAIRTGYIDDAGAQSLQAWRKSPFTWGEERGFAKEEA